MKIAIIGAGAIGSVAAAYLHKAGVDVVLVGREDQVKAIKRSGLKVSDARGSEVFKLKALTKLDKAYDLVIFTTKTQDLEAAYAHNSDYLDDRFVLTTQNGVQADNILSCHFEKDKMFSSIVMYGATYIKPGEVIFNFEGDWIIGNPYTPVGPKTHEISALLKKAFNAVVSNDIMGMKYLKLFVNFNNCIPALIGKSMQETFADLDLCRLSILLLKEGVGVMKKANIELVSMPQFPVERIYGLVNMPIEQASGIINQTLTKLSKEPLYGSILQSIQRGRTSEIDFINGEVVHMARQMRQEAPLNERIVDMIHGVERTQQYFEPQEVKEIFNLAQKEAKS
ncbi:MAG TPA: 2-dehydropantoate 2-reductase [Candidatus Omnitrophota bacterium]|nr:2-dehydropantoate 2-reductase [Candidatus Omnitrophota bacterium]